MHPIMEILMDEKQTAGAVIENLLQFYIQRRIPPLGTRIFQEGAEDSPGVFKFVRRAAGKALRMADRFLTSGFLSLDVVAAGNGI